MATVFDVFRSIPYQFLVIDQAGILGDVILEEIQLQGIFKDKNGQTQTNNMETAESSSTLHVHPEDFPGKSCSDLVSQGVRVNGVSYRIIGATAGTNFDTGVIEHYRLTLQRAEFSERGEYE